MEWEDKGGKVDEVEDAAGKVKVPAEGEEEGRKAGVGADDATGLCRSGKGTS